MFQSTRKRMQSYRNSFKSKGPAFLSPQGSKASTTTTSHDPIVVDHHHHDRNDQHHHVDEASMPLMHIGDSSGEGGGNNNHGIVKGVRSFISKLGLESSSDLYHQLSVQDDDDDQLQHSFLATTNDWKQPLSLSNAISVTGNKENQGTTTMSSPLKVMTTTTTDHHLHQARTSSAAGTLTPRLMASQKHHIPTPRSRSASSSSAAGGGILTPSRKQRNLSFTQSSSSSANRVTPTMRMMIDTATTTTAYPQPDQQDTVLLSSYHHEPEPVSSPRGNAGPLYMESSSSSPQHDDEAADNAPEPVLSPKGETGPLYMQQPEQPSTTTMTTQELAVVTDPYEWAYQKWRELGLMPIEPHHHLLLCDTAVTTTTTTAVMVKMTDAMVPYQQEHSMMNHGGCSTSSSVSSRSRRLRFANVRQHWEDKSKDLPHAILFLSPMTAATSSSSPWASPPPATNTTTTLPLPPSHEKCQMDDEAVVVMDDSNATTTITMTSTTNRPSLSSSQAIVATSASSTCTSLSPFPSSSLSNYLTKYSPPRKRQQQQQQQPGPTLRCSLNTSEPLYNDGSEPYARGAACGRLEQRKNVLPSSTSLSPPRWLLTPGHETVAVEVDDTAKPPSCREIVVVPTILSPSPQDAIFNEKNRDIELSNNNKSDHPTSVMTDLNVISSTSQSDDDQIMFLALTNTTDESSHGGGSSNMASMWKNETMVQGEGSSYRHEDFDSSLLLPENRNDNDNVPLERSMICYQRDEHPLNSDGEKLLENNSSHHNKEPCLCGKPFFKGNEEFCNFFLPRTDMGCTCDQNHNFRTKFINPQDPMALENILRPWQCDFLRTYGIWKGDELVKAHHRSVAILAKGLKQYWEHAGSISSSEHHTDDHSHGQMKVRTRSCVLALTIWSRSCKLYVRAIRSQRASQMDSTSFLSSSVIALYRPNILGSLSLFLQQLDLTDILEPPQKAISYHRNTEDESDDEGKEERQPYPEQYQRRKLLHNDNNNKNNNQKATKKTTHATRESYLSRRAMSRPAIEAESQMEV